VISEVSVCTESLLGAQSGLRVLSDVGVYSVVSFASVDGTRFVVGAGATASGGSFVGWSAVVATVVARAWAALRAVRSAAVVSLWRAVEMVDQRVAAARAVMTSTAASSMWMVALPRSEWVMGPPLVRLEGSRLLLGGWALAGSGAEGCGWGLR
jgi:hypothetical protein